MELQESLDPGAILFSDGDMLDQTEVILADHVLEQLEEYQERTVDTWITRALSICALIVSVIALFRS